MWLIAFHLMLMSHPGSDSETSDFISLAGGQTVPFATEGLAVDDNSSHFILPAGGQTAAVASAAEGPAVDDNSCDDVDFVSLASIVIHRKTRAVRKAKLKRYMKRSRAKFGSEYGPPLKRTKAQNAAMNNIMNRGSITVPAV